MQDNKNTVQRSINLRSSDALGAEQCVSRLFARLLAITAAVNPGYLLTVCLKHLRAANSASRLEMCGTVCNLTTDAVITSQQQAHALRRPSDDRASTKSLCDCVWACTSSRVPPPSFYSHTAGCSNRNKTTNRSRNGSDTTLLWVLTQRNR